MKSKVKAIIASFALLSTATFTHAQAPAEKKAPVSSEAMQPFEAAVKNKMSDTFIAAIEELQGKKIPADKLAMMSKRINQDNATLNIFQWDQTKIDKFKSDPTILKSNVDYLNKPPTQNLKSNKLAKAFSNQLKDIDQNSKLEDKLALVGIKQMVQKQIEFRLRAQNIMLAKTLHLKVLEAEEKDFTKFKFTEDQLFTNTKGEKIPWIIVAAKGFEDPILIAPEKIVGKYIVLLKDGAVNTVTEDELAKIKN